MAEELLTTRQVARAIGVSESSLKRWCDDGRIPVVRTAGGHRRLPISGVVAFLRESGHAVVDSGALGLPAVSGTGPRTLQHARHRLHESLLSGDDEAARRAVLDLYLAGHRVSAICDEVVAPTFAELGEGWECGDVAVFQERRACEIALRVLHELRALLPPVAGGPVAVGGSPEGDPYHLPSTMVELVLRARGWRACTLGSHLPFDTLVASLAATRPALFWLSVTHVADEAALVAGCERLFEATRAAGIPFVVGGRGLTESRRARLRYTVHCDSLGRLEDFLDTLPPLQPSGLPASDRGSDGRV